METTEDLIDRTTACVINFPAREVLGDWINVLDVAVCIGGDYTVTN